MFEAYKIERLSLETVLDYLTEFLPLRDKQPSFIKFRWDVQSLGVVSMICLGHRYIFFTRKLTTHIF